MQLLALLLLIIFSGFISSFIYFCFFEDKKIKELKERLEEEKKKSEEYQMIFDLQYKRLIEANNYYRAKNPGNELVIQDLGELLKWFYDRVIATDLTYSLNQLNNKEKFLNRANGINKWLKEDCPHIFTEQQHIRKGTTGRYYWHYGYMMALYDVLRKLEKEEIND